MTEDRRDVMMRVEMVRIALLRGEMMIMLAEMFGQGLSPAAIETRALGKKLLARLDAVENMTTAEVESELIGVATAMQAHCQPVVNKPTLN